jgi:hypothetical protein
MLRLLVVAVGLAAAVPAHAQTGMCSGGLMGTVGIATKQSDGSFLSVAPAAIPFMFPAPECVCDTTDIFIQIQLTMALPTTPSGTLEVWAGNGCDNYTTRTTANQTRCQKLTDLNGATFQTFTTGSPTAGSPFINIPISSTALFSPNVTPAVCTTATQTNGIYVLLITTDPTMPAGMCTLTTLTEQAQPPTAVMPTVASGDGSLTVSWPALPVGSVVAKQFQLLCADDAGNPITDPTQFKRGYTVCINGTIERRQDIATSGGNVNVDLGTNFDLAGMSLPLIPDGQDGTAGTGTGSLHTEATPTPPAGLSTTLDPAFICSDIIAAGGQATYTDKVSNLTNGKTYQIVVLSIDQFGNATPSSVLTGTPQPAEDLYGRLTNSGSRASGFCFIATAAFGSYESRWVHVLRDFRDEWLLPTPQGRAFVDWYYAHSPAAADWIAEHRAARVLVQMVLLPVIAIAAFLVYFSWPLKLLSVLALYLLLRRRERRRLAEAA